MKVSRHVFSWVVMALFGLSLAPVAFGQTPAAVDFEKEVQPILTTSCATSTCHIPGGSGPMSLRAGESFKNLLSPASPNLPKVIPKDPARSELVRRLEGTSVPRMPLPPNSPLPQAQIDLIKRWITEGALEKPAAQQPSQTTTGVEGHVDSLNVSQGTLTLNTGISVPSPSVPVVDAAGKETTAGLAATQGLLKIGTSVAVDFRQDSPTGPKIATRIQVAGTGGLAAIPDQANRVKGTIMGASVTATGGFVRLLFFACRITADTKIFDEKGATIGASGLRKDDRVRVMSAPAQAGQLPVASEIRVLERALQPVPTPTPTPTPAVKITLVSVKVDGKEFKKLEKNDPIAPGKHRVEMTFDTALTFHIDSQSGDFNIDGVELLLLPFPTTPPETITPTADRKGFSTALDLPANATYQLVVLTNVDQDNQVISNYYFGTTALSDATVSGSITLPEGTKARVGGGGFALLLSMPPEHVLGSNASSKLARAAKRVAERLARTGARPSQNGSDQDFEDALLSITLRASFIDLKTLTYSFPYVPNGQYYLVTIADVEKNGQSGNAFGAYDIEGDGVSDPFEVRSGRSVEGLEVATFLIEEGGTPPPVIRGSVARVDLTQQQFAIGRNIGFDADRVVVIGGQGGQISVRDLQSGFPVLVTLEPGTTPLKAVEIKILRPGQTLQPGMNQTIGTIDRVDSKGMFLIERRFEFNRETMFVDVNDNPMDPRNLMVGDFVEVEADGGYAVHVKVLPSGFIPGQNPDQVTGAALITRTGSIPADGATGLTTNPQLQISFNGPANQQFIDNHVEVVIVPHSEDILQTYEAKNGKLVANLSLKTNTAYTMWINIYGGQKAPFAATFTTGTALPAGGVSGQLTLPSPNDIPGLPAGAALSINPAGAPTAVLLLKQDPATVLPLLDSGDYAEYVRFLGAIAGVGIIQPNGSYQMRGVSPGDYYVVAIAQVDVRRGPTGPVIPDMGRQLRGFYDRAPADGKADKVTVQSAAVRDIGVRLNPPPALKVVKVTPADNAVNVPLETTLAFTFSNKIAIDGDGFVDAAIHLFPQPESGDLDRGQLYLSDDGKTILVDVNLAGNTTYQAFVLYAAAHNESLLPVSSLDPQTGFSTGATVGTGRVSGEVVGVPGGTITRDVGLIFTYLIPASIDLRDLGPGDLERLSASLGLSDGSTFKAQHIPEGKYYALVEVHQFEDESSLYGYLLDPQNKPRILTVGRGEDIKGLRVQVSPRSPFEQETRALRVLNVQAFNDKNSNGKMDSDELVELQEGVGGIPVKTQILVTFSEAIQVSREFVGVNAELIPAARTGDLFKSGNFRVQDHGRQVAFTVELAASTDYQFIVRGAVGESGAELRESEERFFTTKTTKVTLGSISGKISLSDKSRPKGSVFASVKSGTNEVIIAQADADSVYAFPRLPDGKYFIVADLTLENGLKVGGFYDRNRDGKRGDDDLVEIKGGNLVTGIDIGPLTVPAAPGPVTGGGANAKVTASFDFGADKGDQKKTRVDGIEAATDVRVAVYAQGVKDLSGYTVTLTFDPKKLAFNGAENDNTSEGTNLLKTSGGVAVFLPPNLKGGNSVEFGGAVLAATEATAPDGDGLLGVFRFKTTETFDSTTTITLSRLVLKGVAGSDTVKAAATAIVSRRAETPSTGTLLTPKAGDGTGALDLDTAAGDQKSQTLNGVKAGQKVEVQVLLNRELANASGFQVVLKFDPKKLSSLSVTARKDGTAFASAIDLAAQVKGDSVVYGASFLGTTTTAKKEAIAVVTFQTAGDYTGDTEITLSSLSVRVAGAFNTTRPGASVVLSSSAGSQPKAPTPDFSGDGEVGFDDFFLFASAFGQKATGDNAKFDLDKDGEVGFGDFFEFAGKFGQKVSKKPALAKPAGLGAAGVNGDARLGLQVLPSDRQDIVTVDLKVSGAAGLKGYGVDLSYDPAELEFIESKPEGTFEPGGEARPLLRVSDGLGQVHLGDVLTSQVVSGEETLNRLTFRIRPGGGIGSLRLSEGLLLDAGGLTNRVAGAGLEGNRLVPMTYGLSQNYPNPFNPVTQVSYQVPESGRVHLVVYNILGQRVRTLVNEPVQAGFYRMLWDGRDDQGRSVSSGLYLYRMEAGKFSQVHKMMLLK